MRLQRVAPLSAGLDNTRFLTRREKQTMKQHIGCFRQNPRVLKKLRLDRVLYTFSPRVGVCEFEDSLVYIVSFRTARDTE